MLSTAMVNDLLVIPSTGKLGVSSQIRYGHLFTDTYMHSVCFFKLFVCGNGYCYGKFSR